jgi:hypothetical protein
LLNNKPIIESSLGPARPAATAGNFEVSRSVKALLKAANYSASIPITQHCGLLGDPTPNKGKALLFKNSDEEL